jgi:hypothetical protein
MPWVQHADGVHNVDNHICKHGGAAVRIVACIEDPLVIAKILTHLDEKNMSAEVCR